MAMQSTQQSGTPAGANADADSSATEPQLQQLLGEMLAAEAQHRQETTLRFDALKADLDALSQRLGQIDERLATQDPPGQDSASHEPVTPEPIPVAVSQPAPQASRLTPQASLLVFTDELADDDSIAHEREQLLAALGRQDAAATSFVGQLLTFRAASPERMPQLLRDVGEAYYRWEPQSGVRPAPLCEALIRWLTARSEAAGLGNTIQLVRVGDRFDAKRHNAKGRGVEICGVGGWVVLREGGKVYTKANVEVR